MERPALVEPLAAPGLRLLVAIPALDEERTIADVVRGVPRALPGVTRVDVVVVDDGSGDATAARAEAAGARVIRHARTRGVGGAFHSALRAAIEGDADLVATLDGDGQFDPADLARVVAPVAEDRADFCSGSRFADPRLVPEMPAAKRWGNRVLSRLVSHLAGQRFHDVSCGMRCYGRRAIRELQLLGRATYTQEVFLNLAFHELRIAEVPIRVHGEREFGESRVARSLWRYALRSLRILARCYRDYRPLRFFGGLAAALALPALGLAGFLAAHYLSSGQFTPHKWAGFSAAALAGLALLCLHLGLVGDMLARHRAYLEELLVRDRERAGRERPRA